MLFEKKKKMKLKIGGMHCEHCAAKVKSSLKSIGALAEVDVKLGTASVVCPASLGNDDIIKAVEGVGFTCEIK